MLTDAKENREIADYDVLTTVNKETAQKEIENSEEFYVLENAVREPELFLIQNPAVKLKTSDKNTLELKTKETLHQIQAQILEWKEEEE